MVTLGAQALFLGGNIQPIPLSARMFQEWKENSMFFGFWKELLCFCDNNTIKLNEFQKFGNKTLKIKRL